MRRVVVTGMGMVTPLGCGVEATWAAPARGRKRRAQGSSTSRSPISPAKIACSIPRGDGTNGTYNPDQWMEPKEQRKVDDFIVYAHVRGDAGARRCRLAADDAMTSRSRPACMIGSGIGGIEGIAETAVTLHEKRPAPGVAVLHSRAASSISPPATCRSSTASRGRTMRWSPPARPARMPSAMPARMIALGDADVMVAGGAESPVNRISLAGFAALRALSTGFNDEPTRPRGPTTRTATASSWARAPASWCWKSSSTPRRAAPRSMPR